MDEQPSTVGTKNRKQLELEASQAHQSHINENYKEMQALMFKLKSPRQTLMGKKFFQQFIDESKQKPLFMQYDILLAKVLRQMNEYEDVHDNLREINDSKAERIDNLADELEQEKRRRRRAEEELRQTESKKRRRSPSKAEESRKKRRLEEEMDGLECKVKSLKKKMVSQTGVVAELKSNLKVKEEKLASSKKKILDLEEELNTTRTDAKNKISELKAVYLGHNILSGREQTVGNTEKEWSFAFHASQTRIYGTQMFDCTFQIMLKHICGHFALISCKNTYKTSARDQREFTFTIVMAKPGCVVEHIMPKEAVVKENNSLHKGGKWLINYPSTSEVICGPPEFSYIVQIGDGSRRRFTTLQSKPKHWTRNLLLPRIQIAYGIPKNWTMRLAQSQE